MNEEKDYDKYTLAVGQVWKLKTSIEGFALITEVNERYSPTMYKFKWIWINSKEKSAFLGKTGNAQYIHFKKYYPETEYPELYL